MVNPLKTLVKYIQLLSMYAGGQLLLNNLAAYFAVLGSEAAPIYFICIIIAMCIDIFPQVPS